MQDAGLSKACHQIADSVWREAAKLIEAREEEISSLMAALRREKLKTQKAQKRVGDLKRYFLSAENHLEKMVESHYRQSDEEVAAKHKALKEQWDKKTTKTLGEAAMFKAANKALSHNLVEMIRKEVEPETRWSQALEALEGQLSLHLAEKDQLQKEKTRAEEEWQTKTFKLEEEVQLLQDKVSELQVG